MSDTTLMMWTRDGRRVPDGDPEAYSILPPPGTPAYEEAQNTFVKISPIEGDYGPTSPATTSPLETSLSKLLKASVERALGVKASDAVLSAAEATNEFGSGNPNEPVGVIPTWGWVVIVAAGVTGTWLLLTRKKRR